MDLIGPDITVCNVDQLKTEDLYRSTSHELAHATHFQQVGASNQERARWWSYVFNYEATCIVLSSGAKTYEYPGLPYEERVGIAEMWAYAAGYIMLYEYLEKDISSALYPKRGNYWFKPEIIWELYKVGMSLQDINQSMIDEVVTMQSFKNQLISDNLAYKSQINSIFN